MKKVNFILGIPRIWWPKLHTEHGGINRENLLQVANFLFLVIKNKFQMVGARVNERLEETDSVLLNRKCPLGEQNDLIYIEKDDVIFRSVLLKGSWGSDESKYLSSLLTSDCTLVDLGANVGLITRQILSENTQAIQVIVVEPRKKTMANLKSNLNHLFENSISNIEYCEIAIGSSDGKTTLYTEANNIGNSSLMKDLTLNTMTEDIQMVSGKNFYSKYLSKNRQYVLKSDLQGLDAAVLNQFDDTFWEKVLGGIIEVWPNEYLTPKDVIELACKLSNQFQLSFSSNFAKSVDKEELIDYWLTLTNKSQNLFFRRRP